ncbi:MAG: AbrB/MazE/SpoVT family DNA-binding domain-containing protein [Candidatus Thermoplasmatota archaeon]|nr:AbrB/MazE/SpoVT family DNA-binding domain-containing protein [Candidatus Thermoplasmatota archaeon]
MAEITKMDERGRITIPKELRNTHDLEGDEEFLIEDIDDETFIITKVDLKGLIDEAKKELEGENVENLHEEVKKEVHKLSKEKFSC